jgi:hypothetical protein
MPIFLPTGHSQLRPLAMRSERLGIAPSTSLFLCEMHAVIDGCLLDIGAFLHRLLFDATVVFRMFRSDLHILTGRLLFDVDVFLEKRLVDASVAFGRIRFGLEISFDRLFFGDVWLMVILNVLLFLGDVGSIVFCFFVSSSHRAPSRKLSWSFSLTLRYFGSDLPWHKTWT